MLTIYSKNNCPFCVKAIDLLEKNEIDYTVIKIDEDYSAKEFLISSGFKSVPQIFKNGELLVEGGYTGLKEWAINNNLKI